jgi:predicted DNA-binding antitoxin AbrB/MazE fold protein
MKTVHAVCRNGVFQPEGPVSLIPGSRVEVHILEETGATEEELRARFPNSCGALSGDEADGVLRAIDEECERMD